MNPFATRFVHNQSWIVSISAMSLVLGVMIGLARVTGGELRQSRVRLTDPDQQGRLTAGSIDVNENLKKLQVEVNKLREENTKLQNLVSHRSDAAKELNTSLQDAKIFAALTELQGPGVVVELKDSSRSATGEPGISIMAQEQIIHDQDVLRVVNELYAAGAEALSINNIRLGPASSVRCVGPVVHIDGVKVASPIRIRAIGDPETLKGALNLPGGILDELRSVDPSMVRLEDVPVINLPAYSGPTARRFATVPKAKS